MIYNILTFFFFGALLFFMASILYTHYINKKLDIKKKDSYNEDIKKE